MSNNETKRKRTSYSPRLWTSRVPSDLVAIRPSSTIVYIICLLGMLIPSVFNIERKPLASWLESFLSACDEFHSRRPRWKIYIFCENLQWGLFIFVISTCSIRIEFYFCLIVVDTNRHSPLLYFTSYQSKCAMRMSLHFHIKGRYEARKVYQSFLLGINLIWHNLGRPNESFLKVWRCRF